MTRTALQPPHTPACSVTRGEATVLTIDTRADDDVTAGPGRDVVVDLARVEPVDVGTVVVDLAQADSTGAGAVPRWGAGRQPDHSGLARRRLSPSWPSSLRVTNALGTTDSIAGEGPTS